MAATRPKTALMCAEEGDSKTLDHILTKNPFVVNVCDDRGFCPLHHAAYSDEGECAAIILASPEIDSTMKTNRGCTALHIACVSNSSRVLSQLLKHSIGLIDQQNDWGETALHLACGVGSVPVIRILLEYGASHQIIDQWNRTPMQVCIEHGTDTCLDLFTNRGVTCSQVPVPPTPSVSAETKRAQNDVISEFMTRLSNYKPLKSVTENVTVKGIFKSDNEKQLEVMTPQQVLHNESIAYPPPSDSPKNQPTHYPKRCLSKLIEYPGDPVEVATMLADDAIDPAGKDMFGVSALMKFAAWDKCDLIELLLPHLNPSQLNEVSPPPNGFTALHHAADMGAARAFVRLSQELSIDLKIEDKKGRTALQLAEEKGISMGN